MKERKNIINGFKTTYTNNNPATIRMAPQGCETQCRLQEAHTQPERSPHRFESDDLQVRDILFAIGYLADPAHPNIIWLIIDQTFHKAAMAGHFIFDVPISN
jgi:hypothetical protein